MRHRNLKDQRKATQILKPPGRDGYHQSQREKHHSIDSSDIPVQQTQAKHPKNHFSDPDFKISSHIGSPTDYQVFSVTGASVLGNPLLSTTITKWFSLQLRTVTKSVSLLLTISKITNRAYSRCSRSAMTGSHTCEVWLQDAYAGTGSTSLRGEISGCLQLLPRSCKPNT